MASPIAHNILHHWLSFVKQFLKLIKSTILDTFKATGIPDTIIYVVFLINLVINRGILLVYPPFPQAHYPSSGCVITQDLDIITQCHDYGIYYYTVLRRDRVVQALQTDCIML